MIKTIKLHFILNYKFKKLKKFQNKNNNNIKNKNKNKCGKSEKISINSSTESLNSFSHSSNSHPQKIISEDKNKNKSNEDVINMNDIINSPFIIEEKPDHADFRYRRGRENAAGRRCRKYKYHARDDR